MDEHKNLIKLGEVLEKLSIESDVVLVKPNWVGAFPGGYTDVWMVDLLLRSLRNKRIIFVESFSFWRTDKKLENGDDYFSSKEATFDTGRQHQGFFRQMDQWFLKYTGIKEVIEKYQAEYWCVTDELWNGDGVDDKVIGRVVEERYSPVKEKELCKRIPKRLYELRGADFISLAKMKIDGSYGASLSIKNLFGLIPDPNRYVKFHGKDERDLVRNIVDINKIYNSLYKVKYINERIFSYCEMDWESEKSRLIKGDGFVCGDVNGAVADRLALKVLGRQFENALDGLLTQYDKEVGVVGV